MAYKRSAGEVSGKEKQMRIRDLKAVIVDDAAVKSIHIKRALQFCGVENIVMLDRKSVV